MLIPSLLFIASFSLIFILLGMSATVIGSALNTHKETLERVGGVVIILMGVAFLATPFVRLLNREWHSDSLLRSGRPWRTARGRRGVCDRMDALHEHHPRRDPHSGRGFELRRPRRPAAGLLLSRPGDPVPADCARVRADDQCTAIFKRHFPVIIAVGGVVMIALGVLILTGEFTMLNSWASKTLPWQASI